MKEHEIKTERLPVRVLEIIAALEREAANTDTDPRWLSAQELRRMQTWQTRTLMLNVDIEPNIEVHTAATA